jgi:hypothetical protein
MFGLLPRNLEFFDLFEQAAGNALATAELLAELSITDRQSRQGLIEQLKEKEHVGDNIAHETLDRLQTSYLTPIDREDIFGLIKLIDDVVDRIDGVGQRITTYRIEALTDGFREQCQVLVDAVRLTSEAIGRLRHLKARKPRANGPRIEELLIAIHEAENVADALYQRQLGDLFDAQANALDVIKWKEVYDVVEEAVDCCEDIANLLHGILVKNA